MDNQICILIMIGILLLVYFMNKETNAKIERENNEYIQKKIKKKSLIEGNENQEVEEPIEEPIEEPNEEPIEEPNEELNFNEEFKDKLRKEHSMCPHMDAPTRLSVAVHYPPHNTGYILSLCCHNCLKHIQDKLKKGNEEYFFRKEGKDMFFHGENRKQLVLPATPYNIDIMKEITGNDMY